MWYWYCWLNEVRLVSVSRFDMTYRWRTCCLGMLSEKDRKKYICILSMYIWMPTIQPSILREYVIRALLLGTWSCRQIGNVPSGPFAWLVTRVTKPIGTSTWESIILIKLTYPFSGSLMLNKINTSTLKDWLLKKKTVFSQTLPIKSGFW